ncbi:lipase maturation factor family protein [Subtercola sp. YIM 133946]|uniref:lipase maturation factor family protein n=1 Tax=Subtercola sp. YIM 133946 TaxID=3118909 RepID=UPI002F922F78
MEWFDATNYEVARQVLQRGTAAVFVIALISTAAQFPALLGEHGLLPAPRFIARTSAKTHPSVFRWHYSDRSLRVLCWLGAAVAAALVAGLPQLGPPWLPTVAFLLVWALYLSVVDIGQTFYGFGWESLLLEAGFTVAWLGSNDVAAPTTIILLIRWLVFRLEFGAGLIKLRGDRSWRDLTALYYHHETQPMPNPLSRFAHLLPRWMHRGEVLGNHFAQLVVPFFLFAPQPVASVAAAIVIVTQLWLVLSGNFAWLNVLTIILAFSAVSDDVLLGASVPVTAAGLSSSPLWFVVLTSAVAALLLVLSYWPAKNLLSRRQLMNASFNRWHLVNAYGAFGSVTKRRYEVIVEGSSAAMPASDADWLPYEFKGKPGDVRRIPRQFAPYHLRLDWLMWFLALGSPDTRWFEAFVRRLLEADRPTLALLRIDPFDGSAPTWVRARVYLYRFTTRAERRATGQWWMREPSGWLLRPVSLASFR